MSYELYKVLHIGGLVLLVIGLTQIIAAGKEGKARVGTMLHGIGLLVILVAGFGAASKSISGNPGTWEWWLWVKVAVFLVLGALPVLIRKGVLRPTYAKVLLVLLPVAAAWLAITKGGTVG